LQNSQYTTHNKKGMAISIDALLALIIFVAMVAFISTDPASNLTTIQPTLATNQLIDDAIAAMDRTGFIMECIENGEFEEMETKLEAMLPEIMDYNIEIIRYESPLDKAPDKPCRDIDLGQDFETCFPYDTNVYSIGSERPTDKDIFHGQKIFIKKESGDCSIVSGFEEKKKWLELIFAGDNLPEARDVNITTAGSCPGKRNPCPAIEEGQMRCCYTYYDEDIPQNPETGVEYKWYMYDEDTDLWEPTGADLPTLDFDETDDAKRFKCSVRVRDGPNPWDWGADTNSPLAIIGGPCFVFESEVTQGEEQVTEYKCGETYDIDFSISGSSGERMEPVDIMLSLDRSGSMSWLGFNDDTTELAKSIFIDSSGASDIAYFGTNNQVYKFGINNQTGDLTTLTNTSSIDDAQGLFVDDSYVYVADDERGLTILDKDDLSIVRIMGNDSGKEITTAKSVFVEGDYIYLAAAGTYIPGTEKKYDAEMYAERNQEDINIGYSSTGSWAAQSFIPNVHDINGIELEVKKIAGRINPGNLTVHIRQTQTGTDLTNGTVEIAAGDIPTNWDEWITANFNPSVSVTPEQTYYIALTTTTEGIGPYYKWGSRLINPDPYSEGALYACTSGGICTEQWIEGEGWEPNEYEDARFRTFYYSSIVGGLIIIDKSDPDPNNWNILSNMYNTGIGLIDRPQDVVVSGNYAYLTDRSGGDGTQGLWIIDITDKLSPSMKGFVEASNPNSVEVSGNYAYVTDGGNGVMVIDVTNKSNPLIAPPITGLGTVDDIALYGTKIYVNANTPEGGAKNYGVHVIDITTPADPVLQQTFYTQFVIAGENEYALDVSPNWMALANEYDPDFFENYSAMTLSRQFGNKMNIAKESSKEFVMFEDWKSPEDQIGIVSYGGSPDVNLNSELNEASTENKIELNGKIDFIEAYMGTPMTSGLQTAVDELKLPPTGNGSEDAMQFIVLLADGQNDEGGLNVAYDDARANEIYIFTIGFGGDVDTTQLENISKCAYCPDNTDTEADCTDFVLTESSDCGSYHHISDPEALSEVYQVIAQRIAELSGKLPDGATTDIALEFNRFGNGMKITDYTPVETGNWDSDNNILNFENIDIRFGWEGSFEATIACDYVGCGEEFVEGSSISFPPKDTMISYSLDGIEQDPILWPYKFEVEKEVYYNDLGIEFDEGKFIPPSDAWVKYNVLNEGYKSIDLGDIIPTVNFYNGETSETACIGNPESRVGEQQIDKIVEAAYGTDFVSEDRTSETGETNLSGSGYICLWVNQTRGDGEQDVVECAENNQAIINCDIPETYIYTMDYWAWQK